MAPRGRSKQKKKKKDLNDSPGSPAIDESEQFLELWEGAL
jgi:hypothetical protein